MTGWTEERRRKQAEMINRLKPWEKSTGPKTEQGKARSKMNALDRDVQACKEARKLCRLNREFLKQFAQIQFIDDRI